MKSSQSYVLAKLGMEAYGGMTDVFKSQAYVP